MTSGKNFNNLSTNPKILVAPLEWGLGHATRCIPIINELIRLNCQVLIAAEGATFSLLRAEFPSLNFLPLTGYRVKYSRKATWLPLKILSQFPKIAWTIYREHRWLSRMVKEYGIDGVISDNRFGLYHRIPCIYMSHQLRIKTGHAFTEAIAQWLHYRYIKRYRACWVPDLKGGSGMTGLAGELSHPQKLPPNMEYIGALSRFEISGEEIKYDLLVMLSGPEPQRTIFEEELLKQLEAYTGRVLFLRGLPGSSDLPEAKKGIGMVNHLPAADLNKAILQSATVIGRCGYTTVMDLVKLRKKAILVPTPGQTEQEYLADHLIKQQVFITCRQEQFHLAELLHRSAAFPYHFPMMDMEQYKNALNRFVQSL